MQYMGQLNDLEIDSPVDLPRKPPPTGTGWSRPSTTTYARVYSGSARSPELGFGVTGAILRGTVITQKPVLPEEPDGRPDAAAGRRLGSPSVLSPQGMGDAHDLDNGDAEGRQSHRRTGVIESPSTTFVVPDGFETTSTRIACSISRKSNKGDIVMNTMTRIQRNRVELTEPAAGNGKTLKQHRDGGAERAPNDRLLQRPRKALT